MPPRSVGSPGPDARSAPAEKNRLPPVRMPHHSSASSSSSFSAASRPAVTSAFSAFRFSSRSMVMTSTRPRRSWPTGIMRPAVHAARSPLVRDDHDGARRMLDDLGAYRAHQQPGKAAHAARPENYHVGVLRSIDQFLDHKAAHGADIHRSWLGVAQMAGRLLRHLLRALLQFFQ